MKSNKTNDWKQVDEVISVIGSKERFSLHIKIDADAIFQINGCKVRKGSNGEFISFPAWKDDKGEWHDYAFVKLSDEDVAAIIDTLK